MEKIFEKLSALPGKIGFYYKDLTTGHCEAMGENISMMAASVIKLFVMAEAYRQYEAKEISPDREVIIHHKDCVPSCGAIAYMHEGLSVTVQDLVVLMIIFSDNSATNYLIDLLGQEKINENIKRLGYRTVALNRKMFEIEKSRLGIQNRITAAEVGDFLERLYRKEVVSEAASAEMIAILRNQQLNNKMPFYVEAIADEDTIAHKTGEDDGITHDCGIVFADHPFVLCFCGNETDVPAFNRAMGEITLELYQRAQGIGF